MEDRSDIEECMEKLKKGLGDDFTAFIMYGSRTTESYDDFSDTDLCIIVRERDEESMQLIREATNEMDGRKYFMLVVDEGEFETNVIAGDVFYKHEVLGKGKILHERNVYLSEMQTRIGSMETDFELIQSIQKERYRADKSGLMCGMEEVLERLMWGFRDLTYLRLAQIQEEPVGMEEAPTSMERDDILKKYSSDYVRIRRIYKAFQHRQADFPFEELGYFSGRLEQMEDDILR